MIAIHVTYEKDMKGKKNAIAYVANDSQAVKRLVVYSVTFEKYLNKIPKETTIRLTSSNSADFMVGILQSLHIATECCHWHATGIEKGLPPEDIAKRFASLPASIFRPLLYREELADLRRAVSSRHALLQFYGDAVRRIKGAARIAGIADSIDDPYATATIQALGMLRMDFPSPEFRMVKDEKGKPKKKYLSWDAYVTHKAEEVPECLLFAKVAKMKSLILAAQIVSVLGDVSRFDGQVSAVWKYLGQHVVDGKSPKREKGQPSNWSTKGRTSLYLLGSCIMKDRENPWRDVFDRNREIEIAEHDRKHPNCKTKDGHCTAMAMRKVTKEIVKQFVLAASDQKYIRNHKPKARSAAA